MRVLVLIALVGISTAENAPSSSYGAPNGGFTNGFGASNGARGNGFGAPPSNGYGAPPSNGYGAPPSNGNGAPPSNGYRAPPSNGYGAPTGGYGQPDELAALLENIPGGGVPGQDYPVLASVPDTGFSCDDQVVPGYYADTAPEAGCQVFHICQDRALSRQQDSFLCPNGTIFNQQYLVCDWWFNVDCSQAESFYSVNELIGVVPNGGYGYGPNGNGNGNGRNGGNGYGSNGNGRNNGGRNGGNGYGSPSSPSQSYGAPTAPSNSYGAPV